jgi:uncharacterized protein (TIGR02145 family)
MKYTIQISALVLSLFLLYSCKKDKVPTVTTSEVTNIMASSATSGGTITDEGSGKVVERGICWSKAITPTVVDNKTLEGSGAGTFLSNFTNLDGATTYYVRAYAKNSAGIGYGMAMSFTTLKGINDVDGNVYQTVTIGTQVWMAENLKTTKYRNGDLIGTTTPATLDISAEATPKYQWAYEGSESNANTYGRLYTWYAVTDTRNVCPVGWHMSTDAEWTTLITYLGDDGVAGGKLKETGTTHWQSPNEGASNSSGFTALPSGFRNFDGRFYSIGGHGYLWSSSEYSTSSAYYRELFYNYFDISRRYFNKANGFSVRCLRDN